MALALPSPEAVAAVPADELPADGSLAVVYLTSDGHVGDALDSVRCAVSGAAIPGGYEVGGVTRARELGTRTARKPTDPGST